MGKVENLKEEEEEAIEELRARVKNVLTTEMYGDDLLFYRFLKARDFDLDKAELMLRKNIIFRKALRVDSITQDFQPKEAFLKYIQGTHLGVDKSGCTLRYFSVGRIDVQDIVNCFNYINYYMHWVWLVETDGIRLKETNIKSGRNASKLTVILDVDGLELSNVCYPYTAPLISRLAVVYQDNYPETLNAAFIINAPTYLVLLTSMLKSVVAPEVFKKVKIFGKSGWKEEFLKVIDADVLPACLGGNRTDPDGNPMCNTFVIYGSKMDKKYYLSKQDKTLKDKPQATSITIQPKKTYEVTVEINECGSVIEWEIEVKNKDVGVGIFFKDSKEGLKELSPVYRYETYIGIHQDSYKCQQEGTYVILFDNSYSWFHAKKILYCIRVVKPTVSSL